MHITLEEMMAGIPPDRRENIQKEVDECAGAEIYRREFGWTTEDYALDKELWPESYICIECGGEMAMKVSGLGGEQRMTFTCACGNVLERSTAA